MRSIITELPWRANIQTWMYTYIKTFTTMNWELYKLPVNLGNIDEYYNNFSYIFRIEWCLQIIELITHRHRIIQIQCSVNIFDSIPENGQFLLWAFPNGFHNVEQMWLGWLETNLKWTVLIWEENRPNISLWLRLRQGEECILLYAFVFSQAFIVWLVHEGCGYSHAQWMCNAGLAQADVEESRHF